MSYTIALDWRDRYRQMLITEAERAAKEVAHFANLGHFFKKLALCYKPAGDDGTWGEVRLIPLDPGWEREPERFGVLINTHRYIKCDLPYASYFTWLLDNTGDLSLLGS